MSIWPKVRDEIRSLAAAMLFFGAWIVALVLIKQLLLAEYHIEFHGLVGAAVGTLILAKVVLVVEHVSLGSWIRAKPAWVDVVARTAMYGAGVVIVLLLEKGFEGRHEHGSFAASVRAAFQHAEIHHVWVNTICLTGALLTYNVLGVVRRNLGEGALLRMLLTPVPPERRPVPHAPGTTQPGDSPPGT